MEQNTIEFFKGEDLDFFTQLHNTDATYRKDNPESLEKGKRVKNQIFEKTNYWASLVATQLPQFDYEEDNGWNVSGHFKKYSWARLYLRGQREKKYFVTLGVSSGKSALVYKFDCQREGTNKLDDEAIKKFDSFSSTNNRNWQEVPANKIAQYDWQKLASESVDFVNENLEAFKAIHNLSLTSANPQANMHSLNTILFGPPGTGKTYHSINHAISIIENCELSELKAKERVQVKASCDKYVAEGKIVFITFHQSMSYEDFIEGIKPIEPNNIGESMSYKIMDGIFKRACAIAAFNSYQLFNKSKTQSVKYSFDDLFEAFIESIQEQILRKVSPVYKTLRGREVEVKEINSNGSIIARAKNSIAKSSAPLTKENMQKLYDRFKSIDQIEDLKQVQETVQVTPRITEFYAVFSGLKQFEKEFKPDEKFLSESNSVDTIDIEEIVKKFNAGVYTEAVKTFGEKAEPVVLVIDEINRGNISQIFGELITLIEPDKRLGKNEAIEVFLPYSKAKFGVPSNLYIIGTLNTADRSVEALDTALRRRFEFIEMPPKYDLKELQTDIGGIKIYELLHIINIRLEKLLTKDHLIGHSYFVSVKNPEQLKSVFQNKIIPLLQEYFYGDFGKIGLVLGADFFEPVEEVKDGSKFFAQFKNYDSSELIARPVYRLKTIDHHFDIVSALKSLINQ